MSNFNGYIPAAFDYYLPGIMDIINPKYRAGMNSHFMEKTSGIMTCFGDKMTQSKKWDNNIAKYIDYLKYMRECEISKDLPHYIDSGGFQVLTGKVDLEGVEFMSHEYYKLLAENTDLYDKAFILDLPMNDKCFNSYDDIYYHNRKSYKTAAELPQEIRENILYVSHYSTTENAEVFDRIFNEFDAINRFKHFAIGGIAGRVNKTKHYISYLTIPIVYYLKRAIQNNIEDLHLHFLGADATSSILLYKFAEIIAKEKHGINLRITYDSSIFWPLLKGRKFRCINNNKNEEFSFMSHNTQLNKGDTKTVNDKIKHVLNEFNIENGFQYLGPQDDIWINDVMNEEIEAWMMIHHSEYMYKVAKMLHEDISIAYQYRNTDILKFNDLTFNMINNNLGGKFSRAQRLLHATIPDVVTIIENLDENKTNSILGQHSKSNMMFVTDKILTV